MILFSETLQTPDIENFWGKQHRSLNSWKHAVGYSFCLSIWDYGRYVDMLGI